MGGQIGPEYAPLFNDDPVQEDPEQEDPEQEDPVGLVVLDQGLEIFPPFVSLGEEIDIYFTLAETAGTEITFDALELWVLSADGTDLFKLENTDLPIGAFFVDVEEVVPLTVDVVLDSNDIVPGDYQIELRYRLSDELVKFESPNSQSNPIQITITGNATPPSNAHTEAVIIHYF